MYNITARITHFMGFSRLDSLDKDTTNASSAHVLRNTYTILRITCTNCADVQLTKWELETIATAASVQPASQSHQSEIPEKDFTKCFISTTTLITFCVVVNFKVILTFYYCWFYYLEQMYNMTHEMCSKTLTGKQYNKSQNTKHFIHDLM